MCLNAKDKINCEKGVYVKIEEPTGTRNIVFDKKDDNSYVSIMEDGKRIIDGVEINSTLNLEIKNNNLIVSTKFGENPLLSVTFLRSSM